MKKLIISLILILSSLFVGSCSLGGLKTDLFNNNSEEETAKARKEAIFEALKNKDKDALKAIFSQKAISACARVMCPCADGVACPSLAGYTCQ